MAAADIAEAVLLVVRKLAKWFALGFLVVCLLLAIVFGGFYVVAYFDDLPDVVNEVNGIKLGDKYEDVIFKYPGFTILKDSPSKSNVDATYINEDSGLSFDVDDNFVVNVLYRCKPESDFTSINKIYCGDLGEKLIKRYGSDLRIQCLLDKEDERRLSYRVYDSPKHGTRYHLFSNKVVALQVFKPSDLQLPSVSWGVCN